MIVTIVVLSARLMAQGGPESTVCATIIQKTCKDIFGPFKPKKLCASQACYSYEWCQDPCATEPKIQYMPANQNQSNWDNSAVDTFGPPVPNSNVTLIGSVVSKQCAFWSQCDYECDYDFESGNGQCSWFGNPCVYLNINKPRVVGEPCAGDSVD